MQEACSGEVQMEEALHLSLQLGRLLLANGADTAEVKTAVTRFAAAYGYEAQAWPDQYQPGKDQVFRLFEREIGEQEELRKAVKAVSHVRAAAE